MLLCYSCFLILGSRRSRRQFVKAAQNQCQRHVETFSWHVSKVMFGLLRQEKVGSRERGNLSARLWFDKNGDCSIICPKFLFTSGKTHNVDSCRYKNCLFVIHESFPLIMLLLVDWGTKTCHFFMRHVYGHELTVVLKENLILPV